MALIPYVVMPTFIAKRILRAGTRETVHAFCIFWAILLFLGMLWGGTIDEKLGWPLIMGMLGSTIGVPAVVILCRIFSFRLPWFVR